MKLVSQNQNTIYTQRNYRMKIIEYFNFKNTPLTKIEKEQIYNDIDKFVQLYNQHYASNDINNPIHTNDELHSRIDIRTFCYEIISKGVGKIIYTYINNIFVYSIFIDVGQCFNHEANNPIVLQALKSVADNKKDKTSLIP
jgi:hypothetical protein